MNPLMDAFSSNPWFTATNMTTEVNNIPWSDYKLGQYLPIAEKFSRTNTVALSYRNQKLTLIPAAAEGDTDGLNFTATKGKVIRVDVAGYPASADIFARELQGYIRPGAGGAEYVGLEQYVQERWADMLPSVRATGEFILQGMLENKIMSIDEGGAATVIEDLTAYTGAPQVRRVDWTDANANITDVIAQEKLASEQELGGDTGPVEDWALFLVGPAGEGFRANKALNREKYLSDFQWPASDKIHGRKVSTICENVRLLTYAGAKIGGLSALDLDVRVVNAANVEFGTAYLVPLAQGLFERVYVPAPTFAAVNQPAVPLYSWLAPGADPNVSVRLKLWSGVMAYCTKPRAIRKIKLPV